MTYFVSKDEPGMGVLNSGNENNRPADEFWRGPALPDGPPKYWKNDNGTLAEMTADEKVDKEAELTAGFKSQMIRLTKKGDDLASTLKCSCEIDGLTVKVGDIKNYKGVFVLPASTHTVTDKGELMLFKICFVTDIVKNTWSVVNLTRKDSETDDDYKEINSSIALTADEKIVSTLDVYSLDNGETILTKVV